MAPPKIHSYRTLDAQEILGTIARLRKRIEERFPDSGLGRICEQLHVVSQQAEQRAQWIARPILLLRFLLILLALLVVALTIYHLPWTFVMDPEAAIPQRFRAMGLTDWIQTLEAGTNELLVLGAGAFFLITLERRIKRSRALRALHELRSLAHIIDMHQLTKDPERLLKSWIVTESSPRENLSAFELERYLDYCSEMLSLVAKVAALYVQTFDDSVALSAVNDVEQLTNGLSSKIWQKIMILRVSVQHERSATSNRIVTS